MNPEQWAAIINACLDRGFVLPLHLCAVSVNGAVLVVRYSQSEEDEDSIDGEVVMQHSPEAGSQLPINMIEFIPIKSWVTKGAGAPGNCAGHSRVPSPDHGCPLST